MLKNTAKPSRTIVIGDLHGCFNELQDLLALINANANDQIISVGDLICKGPDSRAVVEWAMQAPNFRLVQGNHEARFLKHWRNGRMSEEKSYDKETAQQLKPIFAKAMEFFETAPLYIDENDFAVVHAGIDTRDGALEKQKNENLVNMRFLPGTEQPWYTQYDQKKLMIFGHWVHRKPILFENTVGLDTGCVYGGFLSALILPERKIVQVPARKVYREKETWPSYKLSQKVTWL